MEKLTESSIAMDLYDLLTSHADESVSLVSCQESTSSVMLELANGQRFEMTVREVL